MLFHKSAILKNHAQLQHLHKKNQNATLTFSDSLSWYTGEKKKTRKEETPFGSHLFAPIRSASAAGLSFVLMEFCREVGWDADTPAAEGALWVSILLGSSTLDTQRRAVSDVTALEFRRGEESSTLSTLR